MAIYWLSFRLEEDATYGDRYEALVTTVKIAANKWWSETSAFYVFESDRTMDELAADVKSSIRPKTDLVVIGMTEIKSARIIGANIDEDIYDLVPFIKNA